MDKVSQIEAELRQMAAVYARKCIALAKLQEAYCSKLNECSRPSWRATDTAPLGPANEMIITDACAAIDQGFRKDCRDPMNGHIDHPGVSSGTTAEVRELRLGLL
ncbi:MULTISPECIES: hypothetical protein [Bradyrhizobium]|uniref:hypothetical protein n=1 Tax=Bradyrhizobium TaxID=374 RepID=UPI00167E9964|nr:MULTISPECIES: hypothetical protein [Bradyrhizobium]